MMNTVAIDGTLEKRKTGMRKYADGEIHCLVFISDLYRKWLVRGHWRAHRLELLLESPRTLLDVTIWPQRHADHDWVCRRRDPSRWPVSRDLVLGSVKLESHRKGNRVN